MTTTATASNKLAHRRISRTHYGRRVKLLCVLFTVNITIYRVFLLSLNVPRHPHPPGHPATAEVQNLEDLGVDGRLLLK